MSGGKHIIKLEDLPHLRLCYDEWIARRAPRRECAWLLDVSGEEPVKQAAWNSRLNGWQDADVSPELSAHCTMLLNALRSELLGERIEAAKSRGDFDPERGFRITRYIPPPHPPCPPLFYPDMHGKHKTDHGSAHMMVWWHWCPWHGGVYLCPDLFDPRHFYTPGCKHMWVMMCSACAGTRTQHLTSYQPASSDSDPSPARS